MLLDQRVPFLSLEEALGCFPRWLLICILTSTSGQPSSHPPPQAFRGLPSQSDGRPLREKRRLPAAFIWISPVTYEDELCVQVSEPILALF